MEVLDKNVALLSNFEVYDLLRETQAKMKGKKSNGRSQNLATITYETSEYLSKSPCVHQTAEMVKTFMKRMKSYKLTKAEKLQLLDLRPSTAVELQLVVDEMDERFSEDEVTELLELIQTLLPAETEN